MGTYFSFLCHQQVSSLEVREKYIGFLIVVFSYFHGFIHLRFKHAVMGTHFSYLCHLQVSSLEVREIVYWPYCCF